MDNLTVNIQAISNTFLPPPHTDRQIQALAQDTEARLGGLRQEIQQTLEQGNNALSGRFQLLSGWCKEVFNCQQRVNQQFEEVHRFFKDIVLNLRTQASYINGLIEHERTDKRWKEDAEK